MWLVGFHQELPVATSSTMSECWVLREGLKLVLDRDLKGIRVVTGSLASVQIIQNEKLGNHDLSNIVFYCRSMLMMLGSEVHHVFREAKFRADMLASLSFNQHNLVVFNVTPNCLEHQLYSDSIGMLFPRTRFVVA
ncbi:hypothetical protein RHGRI_027262 [Rhododendron griersonianum]|uniref:RNase H type-1 domain-containing protein n=1 Tax=Rhododendron griersonianum TaxID=479676 RepID=A0AAV6J1J5_9ERIC|nr:hypothetical protein RHGRI_027262 [Rhododendron griersonianum]